MTFYEFVFIVRQDISSVDVDKIIEDFTKVIEAHAGKIIKTEYWGLRTLAYEINNNTKGHYVFLGIQGSSQTLKELERKLKFSEDVIRSSLIKVEEISSEPSPILRNKHVDHEEVIDVTISNERT